MSRSKTALSAASTTARDVRIAALLRKAANELDPSTTVVTAAKAPRAATKTVSTPPAAQGGDKSCLGCGKALLRVNALCKACSRKGTVEVKTSTGTSRRLNATAEQVAKAEAKARATGAATNARFAARKAAKVAAQVAPEAPAKVTGRRDAKAHCSTVGCGLFVKAGTTVCTKHTTKAVAKAQGQFLTLETAKGKAVRVPADMVVALRKAGVEDAVIVKAAQAKGLTVKANLTSPVGVVVPVKK